MVGGGGESGAGRVQEGVVGGSRCKVWTPGRSW